MYSISIRINKLSDTKNLAKTIASFCQVGEVLLLKGDLGAGKTTFSKYFIQKLSTVKEVTSPTFNIVNIYEGKNFPIYHYDLYRLKSKEELYELGIEEAFKIGITLIEWPEYVENIILDDQIIIYFKHNKKTQQRVAEISLCGRVTKYKNLLEKHLKNEIEK